MKYENKIVGFLDILGFRRLVFQSRECALEVIKELDGALRHALECLELDNPPECFSAKLFSDCFCLTCGEDDLDSMLRELCFMQLTLTSRGIFFAGGVADGLHFENERMIFSEALINAYDLQKDDTYPRIVTHQTIVDRIKKESSKHYGHGLIDYLIMAQDGVYFLDYLHTVEVEEGLQGETDLIFEGHKAAIMRQVDNIRGNYGIVKKYKWLAEYHNFKFHQLYNQGDYVEGYFEELRKRLVIPFTAFPTFKKGDGEFSKVCDEQ